MTTSRCHPDHPSTDASAAGLLACMNADGILIIDFARDDSDTAITGTCKPQASNNYDVILARVNTDGTPDTSFGGGSVRRDVTYSDDWGEDLVIQHGCIRATPEPAAQGSRFPANVRSAAPYRRCRGAAQLRAETQPHPRGADVAFRRCATDGRRWRLWQRWRSKRIADAIERRICQMLSGRRLEVCATMPHPISVASRV